MAHSASATAAEHAESEFVCHMLEQPEKVAQLCASNPAFRDSVAQLMRGDGARAVAELALRSARANTSAGTVSPPSLALAATHRRPLGLATFDLEQVDSEQVDLEEDAAGWAGATQNKPVLSLGGRTVNQYWYSENTVRTLVAEIEAKTGGAASRQKVAFLSTPSLFFSLQVRGHIIGHARNNM